MHSSHLVSHSQSTPSPALSHAPGHLLRRLLMSSALPAMHFQVELDRLLYCVRATVISIRKQTALLYAVHTSAPACVHVPCLQSFLLHTLDSHLLLLRAIGCSELLLET